MMRSATEPERVDESLVDQVATLPPELAPLLATLLQRDRHYLHNKHLIPDGARRRIGATLPGQP